MLSWLKSADYKSALATANFCAYPGEQKVEVSHNP